MQPLTLLWDLAIVMTVAAVVTIVFHRLRQPVILGYILAGLIIGPHTPPFPFVKDEQSIHTLAELGVIFLMFTVGLEFNLRKLKRLGVVATVATTVEVMGMIWFGYQIGRWMNWGAGDSFFLGVALSLSSTIIVVKILREMGKMREPFAEFILAVLIVQDVVAILMLAGMSGMREVGEVAWNELLQSGMRIGLFAALTLILGLLSVPRLVRYIVRIGSEEILVITLLGLGLGMALLAEKMGMSTALGAFLMGALVAESGEVERIEQKVAPLRDVFAALFFVSVGMLIQPRLLVEHKDAVLVATVVAVGGKIAASFIGAFLAGHDERTSARVSFGLVPIGEFSLIIAYFAWQRHLTSDFLYPAIAATAAITTFMTPYLLRSSERIADSLERVAPKPLVTFLSLYGQWIKNLRGEERRALVWKQIRRSLLQILANGIVINVLLLAATFSSDQLNRIAPKPVLFEGDAKALLLTATALLILPFLIAMVRKWQAVTMILSEAALPSHKPNPLAIQVRQTLRATFTFAGIALICGWLLIASASLLPPSPVLLVLLLPMAITATLLWNSMVRVHSRIQATIQNAFATNESSQSADAHDPVIELVRNRYPWLAESQEVILPADAYAAGRSIHELAVRKQTGATIIVIRQGSQQTTNPSPDTVLLAGDVLVILGETDQLARATKLLTNKTTPHATPPQNPPAAR